MHNLAPLQPENKALRDKIAELSKQKESLKGRLLQIDRDLASLQRTEELLFRTKKASIFDTKRDEMREAVLDILQKEIFSLHYKELAKRTTARLGREISSGAMYNFLKRTIARNEAPIEKSELEGHYLLKSPNIPRIPNNDASGVDVPLYKAEE